MGRANGRDVIFAFAGLLWGAVTLYTGVQRWRDEQKRVRVSSSHGMRSVSVEKMESPSMILAGVGLSAGCLGYLIWTLLA
ncbi:MAG TPA: hypothetical protein VMU17_00555 [Elusimicrobiota bacterium]|nr:hypothetical protein [Elusimicrobiota bacterium]